MKGENGKGVCVDVASQDGSWVDPSLRAVLPHVQWRERAHFIYLVTVINSVF